MVLAQVFFYFFAALAVVSGILVITRRNAVHSAIFLIQALLAVAGIFLQLDAELLAAVQVILYVGGIMVLFLFVIMLVNLDISVRQVQFNRQWLLGSVTALIVAAEVGYGLYRGQEAFEFPAAPLDALQPNAQRVGLALFQNYMLPFEIASILLLVAMIGAVLMAKRRL
jgi:NADH-quinone oxidoreductase subunit J